MAYLLASASCVVAGCFKTALEVQRAHLDHQVPWDPLLHNHLLPSKFSLSPSPPLCSNLDIYHIRGLSLKSVTVIYRQLQMFYKQLQNKGEDNIVG
ncbi:hypothetical protein ACSBR1_005343 [Camellia fascicularis]